MCARVRAGASSTNHPLSQVALRAEVAALGRRHVVLRPVPGSSEEAFLHRVAGRKRLAAVGRARFSFLDARKHTHTCLLCLCWNTGNFELQRAPSPREKAVSVLAVMFSRSAFFFSLCLSPPPLNPDPPRCPRAWRRLSASPQRRP